MNILVNGGGGYIGSFMVKALCDRGDTVFVIDNFMKGYREAVDHRAKIMEGDLLDNLFVEEALATIDKLDAVINFAGLIEVGQSVDKPGLYFRTNIGSILNVLEAVKDRNVKFIFSSTAAVYGAPEKVPIPEDHPKIPTNPYGESKLMIEHILSWYNKRYGLSYTALRYFNASGAALDGSMGERHNPETHILPCAIKALLSKKPFHLFGDDYKTPDGTCVRDYIHVLDLVQAHMLALDKMEEKAANQMNVGTGHGYSNKEVLEMVEKVSGQKMEIIMDPRRPGDPDELVADASRIKDKLGFEPKYSDLETIVKSAYLWHSQQFGK